MTYVAGVNEFATSRSHEKKNWAESPLVIYLDRPKFEK